MTRTFEFATVDVFTQDRFGGNPLAVFPDAVGLSDAEMQSLAAEMNLSETTFVLPAESAGNSARVRIFNRTEEMPFAGHPNVGTAFLLTLLGKTRSDVLRFEELAGLVSVSVACGPDGKPTGATIEAPRPLAVLHELPPEPIAACLGLAAADVRLETHPPLLATVGVEFVLVDLSPAAIREATPKLDAFRSASAALLGESGRLSVHMYSRSGDKIHARMFAPMSGTWEDPATGSANATLAALLVSLGWHREETFLVSQGSEMGRPSQLHVRAWRSGSEVRASVGGTCVPMFRGHVEL